MTVDETPGQRLAREVREAREARTAHDADQDDTPAYVPTPVYPSAAMSVGALGDLLTTATSTGLPASLIGGAGLGVAAIATMRARILPDPTRPSWRERPCLWVALVAPPHGGKSPALRIARAPLSDIEFAAYEAWRADMDTWAATPPRERGEKPARDRWTVGDITIEKMFRVLDATGGRAGKIVDELKTHLESMGRYRAGGRGDGGERAQWLSFWDGDTTSFERVTDDVEILIREPVVPVLGGLQPAYVALLGVDEDGSRARWLPHYSPESAATTGAAPASSAWESWVAAAAATRTARTWHLDTATYRTWRAASDRWADLTTRPDTPGAVAGAAGKADRQSLRIALVLAELVDPGRGGAIPPEAMAGAVALADYCIGVWGALGGLASETVALSRRDEVLATKASELAAWIAGRGGRVTLRDIATAKACGLRTKEVRDQVLAQYEALFPGTVRNEPSPSGPPARVVYAPTDPRIHAGRVHSVHSVHSAADLQKQAVHSADTGVHGVHSAGGPGATVDSGHSTVDKIDIALTSENATVDTVDTVDTSRGASTVPQVPANGHGASQPGAVSPLPGEPFRTHGGPRATAHDGMLDLTARDGADLSDAQPGEIGPCVACGRLCRRYGPRSTGPLCPACKEARRPAAAAS